MESRLCRPPKRLLIAEDDDTIASLVARSLTRAGFRTHRVRDGIDALNYVLGSKPDGIILDLVLPRLHGFEICAMVRKCRPIQRIPIVVISGLSADEDKLQAFELGADDYVTKPFNVNELVARVKAVMFRSAKANFPRRFSLR